MERNLIPAAYDLTSRLAEQAQEYLQSAKAENTIKAYRSDWQDFTAWCQTQGVPSLPASAETVALYLTALVTAGRKTSTLTRRISAISQAHQAAGADNPTRSAEVKTVMAGIRRVHGTAQTGKAPAVV
ncbi:MAG: site-specific integrase, partial [Chitinophagales bacterium]